MEKFIISGFPRTGSTLLASSLSQSNNILMFHELFHNKRKERGSIYNRKIYNNETGSTFAEIAFKYGELGSYSAVGFKLFCTHAKKHVTHRTVWDLIEKDKTIKVIMLERPWIEIIVSLEKAYQDNIWAVKKNEEIKKDWKPFSLDHEKCEKYFEFFSSHLNEINTKIKSHNVLEIEYSDLDSNYEETCNKTFNFLNLPNVNVIQEFRKQRKKEVFEQLENYDDLKNKFSKTVFASEFPY